ncbi:glycosyltransferase family 4 protein [Mangrovimonas spongiae]|uniref:Glycosyl transferase family 1 n=1 Tax=Mangrovimonas spongiae TaxID=2494697 RepID=A0A428JX21_9FLAO|nr:glycosyltransferase family 4 protein [Mangrovimonas spongiae]RSK38749.1 glycosyl transferase family 1 [Mangrovimonas spongiae]
MQKKALIIAYYWPPAGGPGVQRWLKFVKYLQDYNVEPIVYVPENAHYPIVDDSLIDEIPESIKVIKHPIKEPYGIANVFFKKKTQTMSKGIITTEHKQSFIEKLLLFIRGNFFIPDARKSWVKPSVAFLKDVIVRENIETIITTGPPHSMHLIGLHLKHKLGVKWLADFRDPWTNIGYHKQLKLLPFAKKKHKRLEQHVLEEANRVIVTSFATQKEFSQKTKVPISVITNGYDTEMFQDNVTLDTKFSISHIGSLLSKRNPEILWKVLDDLLKNIEGFKADFQLTLVGHVGEEVLKSIQKNNLTNYLNSAGYVKHNQSITYQKKSQVLLLLEIDSVETEAIIPGKLFEYLASQRPIVAIGPKQSDVKTILNDTQAGKYFSYNDYNALKKTILEHYKAFKEDSLQVNSKHIEKYSRKALTKALSELI